MYSVLPYTLEYRINGVGENNLGGWKWFDITIIGGWNDGWEVFGKLTTIVSETSNFIIHFYEQ